jgi:hypothetical protein
MRKALAVTLVGLMVAAPAAPDASAAAKARAGGGPQGDSWTSIAKLPDWSGVWELDYRAGGGPRVPPAAPHLTAESAAKLAAYQAAQKRGEQEQSETANCVPPGMPGVMTQPYPVEFLFTPGKVTVAIEAYSQMRRIFTDGRSHPEDPDPTFQGHSIGHWEGDTLVVDTVAVLPSTLIAPGIGHSDDMRIEERIHRLSADVLQISTTITDPKVLADPWTVTRSYRRHPEWDIKEYICTQNNRDSADAQGRAGINIER